MERLPRDQWVFEAILRRICAGTWSEGKRIPPSRHLARQMGVSHVTVQAAVRRAKRHCVLHVRPRQPTTVQVGAAARADRLLTRHETQASATKVAILVPESYLPKRERAEAYYRMLSNSLMREGAKRGIHTGLVKLQLKEQLRSVMLLQRRGYNAAIFIGFKPTYLLALRLMYEQAFPLLVFNCRIEGIEMPTVRLADYEAGQRIAERLVSLGHRNLCMVTHCGARSGGGRVTGWVNYLVKQDLLRMCSRPVHVLPWHREVAWYDPAFVKLVHSHERPTAILFASGAFARRFLANDAFADLRVPDDISLASFEPVHDIPTVPWSPPLTSVSTCMDRTVECVFEQLLRVIGGATSVASIRVPMEINLTESIGSPPVFDSQ